MMDRARTWSAASARVAPQCRWVRAEFAAGRSPARDGFNAVRIRWIGRAAAGRESFAPEAIPKLPF